MTSRLLWGCLTFLRSDTICKVPLAHYLRRLLNQRKTQRELASFVDTAHRRILDASRVPIYVFLRQLELEVLDQDRKDDLWCDGSTWVNWIIWILATKYLLISSWENLKQMNNYISYCQGGISEMWPKCMHDQHQGRSSCKGNMGKINKKEYYSRN